MSVVYLALGVVVESARRLFPTWRFALHFARKMDDLPYTVLLKLGLAGPLTTAYVHEQISEAWLRVVFSATTVAVIFALAFATGGVLGLIRYFALRGRRRSV